MTDIQREKNILRQLVKAQNAVKRKYNILKMEKESFEKAVGDTFKPIVDPLQQLVSSTKQNVLSPPPPHKKQKRSSLNETVRKGKINESVDKTYIAFNNESDESDNESDDSLDETLANKDDRISGFETAASDQEEEEEEAKKEEDDEYMKMLKQKQNNDKIYGVRKEGGVWKLGDSSIIFGDKSIKVKDGRYSKTSGLMELLIAKHPNKQIYNQTDLQNYKSILEATSAHKKGFKSHESIRIHNSKTAAKSLALSFLLFRFLLLF